MRLWLKTDIGLTRNRKTYLLAELLQQAGADLFGTGGSVNWRARAISLLLDFWGYVAEEHRDGDLTAAQADALRDALKPWLGGTTWSTQDVRELLMKSGHVERTRRGRIVVHDWLEWTGAGLEQAAKDRKRKRLEYSKSRRKSPRNLRGEGAAKKALEEKDKDRDRKNLKSSSSSAARVREDTTGLPSPANGVPSPSSPPKVPSLGYTQRCVIALNQAITAFLPQATALPIPASTQEGVVAWEAEGIPLELVERVIIERVRAYRPTARSRYPRSLKYFDQAVREAHELAGQRTGSSSQVFHDPFEAVVEQARRAEAHG